MAITLGRLSLGHNATETGASLAQAAAVAGWSRPVDELLPLYSAYTTAALELVHVYVASCRPDRAELNDLQLPCGGWRECLVDAVLGGVTSTHARLLRVVRRARLRMAARAAPALLRAQAAELDGGLALAPACGALFLRAPRAATAACEPLVDQLIFCMREFDRASRRSFERLGLAFCVVAGGGPSLPEVSLEALGEADAPSTVLSEREVFNRRETLDEQGISHQARVLRVLLKTLVPPGASDSAVSIVAAEVGVRQARTSAYLLEQFPRLRMILVDPYDDKEYPTAGKCLPEALERLRPYCDRVTQMLQRSVEASKWIAPGTLDLVFIDANHTYDAVQAELPAWWRLLRPGGGILAGHDFAASFPGVVRAACEFAARQGTRLVVNGNVWWTVKMHP